MIEETKQNNKRTIQQILRRIIEINTSGSLISSIGINSYDSWENIFNNNPKVSLNKLMQDGWKVVSISQTFAPSTKSYAFGIETVIIEKEA